MDQLMREILGIAADFMTILGISGVFGWGIFRRGRDPIPEAAYSIFSYSVKTAVVMLLLLILFTVSGACASLMGLLISIPYSMTTGNSYALGSSPVPDIVGWIISILIFAPIFVVLANSIYQSSTAPIHKVIDKFLENTKGKPDSRT